MVDFNDNYLSKASIIKIGNETSAWNKKIQKPQLHGGVYHFKCNCDLTNGLQDDCRNPHCRSSYTKLTKRTCSCGRPLIKKSSEGTSKEEKKKEVGDGDGDGSSAAVKESKKPKDKELKEPKEKIPEKESKEKITKEIKVKESEKKENKKPKEKEAKELKKVKAREFIEIAKKKTTRI